MIWPKWMPLIFFIPNFLQKKNSHLKDPKVALECYHKCHWYLANPQSKILCHLWEILFARPAGERHRSSAGHEPGAFILSLPPHWQEKRGTKNIYPYFYDVPSTSENILNSAELSFHAMSQQIILDLTQVCAFILSRYFLDCSIQEASVYHTVWNKPMNVTYLVAASELIFGEKSVWHQNCSSGVMQLGVHFCEFQLLKWETQSNPTGILWTKDFPGYHTSHEFQTSLCNSNATRRRKRWVKCFYWLATSTCWTRGQSNAGKGNKGASLCKLVQN